MNWYITKIVFQVVFNGKKPFPHFEEQVRIILAASKDEAVAKVTAIGKKEEGSVVNINNNQMIQWNFINVSAVYQLKELLDGAEVCSISHEPDNAETFIDMVHSKAAHIRQSDTLEILHLA